MNPTENPNESALFRQAIEDTLYEHFSREKTEQIFADGELGLPPTITREVGRRETRSIAYRVAEIVLKERRLDTEESTEDTEEEPTEVTAKEPVLIYLNPQRTDLLD